MINTTDLNEARKQIQKLKKESQLIIVRAQDEKFNRKILEMKDVDIILGLELHDRRDNLKQRDSGLNEFFCKLAAKNNVKIAIDLNEIRKLDKRQKAIILSRIIQNINLCKKNKAQMILYPLDSYKKQDIIGFFLALGSSTQLTKKAVN